MNIKVTIGMCVHNSEEFINYPLYSILNQNFPHKLIKLIIVDGCSVDNTLNILKDFVSKINIKNLIFQSNNGLGYSRQIIIDNAEGEYVIFIDDDYVLKKSFVKKHVTFMEKNPCVGAASAKRFVIGKTLVTLLESLSVMSEDPNRNRIGTGGSIFRLKATRQVGGFDINILGAGEDLDLSHRIWLSGWKITQNNLAKFSYRGKRTWRTLWKRHFWYGYGHHFLSHKYPRHMPPWPRLLPFNLLMGLRDSSKIYKVTQKSMKKKMFILLPIYYSFRSIAWFFGFVSSHFKGYGHKNKIQCK